ncbi:MAG: response regulator [Candidatus Magnetoovum sp. WYHC-5]|nr:response regulator [Candidatus Magnetoovum sp. WYHC-5]
MKFLVTDDELLTVKMLQRLLSRYGHCDYVLNGKEAVEAFKEALSMGEPYDLIFMDILMPEMDGFDALYAIREKEKMLGINQEDSVKIIMMTGLGISIEMVNLYRTSCMEFLYKPIDVDALISFLKDNNLIQQGIEYNNN